MAEVPRVMFFATRADLEVGLLAVEQKQALQYVLRSLSASADTEAFGSALAIPHLGLSPTGDCLSPDYLVLEAAQPVRIRSVPQQRGGVLYAVDEVANPSAIIFRPGGLYENRCLISGEISAVGDPRSIALYRSVARTVVQGFLRIQEFVVGPEALKLLDAGMRLTQREQAPAACDLHRPHRAT